MPTPSRSLCPVLLGLVLPCFCQSPSLTHTTPGALAPGRTAEVTFQGANLAGATNLWTGVGARVISAVATNSAAARLQVSLPATAPVGLHAARVGSAGGVSAPLLLMVDDLPSVTDAGTNTSLTNAQRLAWPVAVDGAAVALGYKFYRVTTKAGERVAFEVVAQRLGSKLDPVLRLLDARGRELAFCDDESGLNGDCRFAHTFAAAGDYFLEVRDIHYAGGADHRFRLRIGDFPLVSLPFPAAVRAGASGMFNFVGPQVEKLKPVAASAPAGATHLPLAVKFPGGKNTAFAAAFVTDTPEIAETEPNETAETATPFTPPAGLNGRFLKPKERDFWKFEAKKGQRVLFTAQTRSLGSASEVMLQLRDAKGTTIASSAVNDANEGAVTNTIPADGTYFLVVDELVRRGGPQHAYRVEAELLTPGFTLEVEVEKVEAAPGGSFTVKVNATRRDFTGPITLVLAGLEGATLADEVIKEKAAGATLKVTLPDTAVPGSITSFRVMGKAKVGEREVEAVARTTAALKKLFPNLTVPPRELDGLLALGVTARK
jgi:hypothetical protein